MKPSEAEAWKSDVLDELFAALAESNKLQEVLVFKGARVLYLLLGGGRQSLDIDSNLRQSFAVSMPDRDAQKSFLEEEMTFTIRRHFERQNPIRLELEGLQVTKRPTNSHPRGWDAFEVRIRVNDRSKNVRGLPKLEIDIAAPEELLENSISPIPIGLNEVQAYTIGRITGEKLRAFLSSLPTYRAKVLKPGNAVRAKDLYDIARIKRVHDVADREFWLTVGREFQLACRSRFVDCEGLVTFQEQWNVTKSTYSEATIPKDIPFEEAEASLGAILEFFVREAIVPFSVPLP